MIISEQLFGQRAEGNYQLITNHYSFEDGIPHKQVNQSFQDSRGFLWLVTPVGMSVFDGRQGYYAAQWPYLSSAREALVRAEDKKGVIWLRFFNGSQHKFRLFDAQTRKELQLSERLDTVLLGLPLDVAATSEGELLLINHREELWKEDNKGNWLKISSSLGKFNTFTGKQHAGNFIWLTTNNTAKFEPKRLEVISIDSKHIRSKSISWDDFLFFSCGPDESTITYGAKGIVIHHPGGKADRLSFEEMVGSGIISNYYFLADYDAEYQHFWLWHRDFIRVYQLNRYSNGKPKFNLLAERKLDLRPTDVTLIHEGTLAISSSDGLTIIEISPNYFQNLFSTPSATTPRSEMQEARGILKGADGSMYFSIGLSVYHKPSNNEVFFQLPGKKPGITYIAQDPYNNSIWYGGLTNFVPNTKTSRQFTLPDLKSGELTWALTFLDSNSLLLGTSNSLIEFSKKDGSSKLFEDYNNFSELKNASVYHLNEQDPGKWWILAENGLYILEKGKGITAKYGSFESGKYFLPADNFRHYFQDDQGIFWFATSQGLLSWDTASGQSTLWTTVHGLPSNNLYAVYGDKNGYLWISSDKGIIRYLPETGTIRIFLEEDGIQNNEFNRISHFQDADGTLCFGGINGISVLKPDNLKINDYSSVYNIAITSAKIMGSDGTAFQDLMEDFFSKGRLTIPSESPLLHFDLSFPNYHKSKGITYRYKIIGLREKWIYTQTPQIQLLGLTFGNYELVIEAITGSGESSQNALIVPISVLPPFYLNPGFLVCVVIFSLLGIYGFLKRREKSLKTQKKILEEKIAISTQQISHDKALIEQQAELLRHQNKLQQRFFANITHEFRTPLSLVLGPIELLQKQARLSPRQKGMLSIAGRNSRRVLELVDSVLAISTMEANQFQRRDQPLNITSFFFALTEEYLLAAEQKEIVLHTKCEFRPEDLVITDYKIVRIILNNLLSNAIKFTPPKGSVWICLSPENDHILLTVKDTGRGIHPDDLPQIFKRYFQTTRNDTVLEGGTGIGLALVKELLDVLNGTIDVETTFGKGTLFTLRWPLVYAEEEKIIPPPAGKSPASTTKAKFFRRSEESILVVEDNYDYRQYLDYFLSDYFQVVYAANGREALQLLLADLKPDLIITDWMMPEMDGFQLAQRLKSEVSLRSIPLIFLTARSSPADLKEVMRIGLDDYLIKPIDESTLLAAVNTTLERYKMRKSNPCFAAANNSELQILQDQNWLKKLEMETLNGLSNEHFSVDILATRMLMGRSSFYRKVRALTGLTPNEYILEARLVTARQLMESRPDLTLKKVVQMVGLKAKHNFSKAFQERFGHPPTWYLG